MNLLRAFIDNLQENSSVKSKKQFFNYLKNYYDKNIFSSNLSRVSN
jgi:hypothetical protein